MRVGAEDPQDDAPCHPPTETFGPSYREKGMDHTIVVSVTYLAPLAGVFIPLLTGLITQKLASGALKSICTAVLTVIAGVVATAMSHDGQIPLESSVMNVLISFVTAISTYYGFWKPSTIADKVQNIAPTVGIGTGAAA